MDLFSHRYTIGESVSPVVMSREMQYPHEPKRMANQRFCRKFSFGTHLEYDRSLR